MSELCGAKLNKKRGRCKKPAGHGTSHPGYGYCSLHLGCTPMGERWAIKKEVEAKRNGYGVAVDVEPQDALLLCIRLVAGEVQYASERVDALEAQELLVRPEEWINRPLSEGREGENPGITVQVRKTLQLRLNTWIEVRHEGMDRLAKYSALALRSGLEERMVQIAEVQGRLLAEAVRGILEELGVGKDPRAPAIVRKHLTQITERTSD